MKRNEIHEGSIFISFEKIYELYWAGPCPLCLGFAGDGSCRARPEEPEAQYDYDETACTRWTSPANSPPPYAAQLMPYRQKNMTAQGPLSSDTALESCTSTPLGVDGVQRRDGADDPPGGGQGGVEARALAVA